MDPSGSPGGICIVWKEPGVQTCIGMVLLLVFIGKDRQGSWQIVPTG